MEGKIEKKNLGENKINEDKQRDKNLSPEEILQISMF